MLLAQTQKPLLVAVAVNYIGGACGWDIPGGPGSNWQLRLPWSKQNAQLGSATRQEGDGFVVDHITVVTIATTETQERGYPKVTAAPVIKRKLGSVKWDGIHERMQARKRDGESCPKDYQLCPQTVGGGCCPKDRVCGENSCLPSTATNSLACGRENYIACGLDDGGMSSRIVREESC